MIQALSIYHIRVRGEIDARVFNATSPLQIAVTGTDQLSTQFSIASDQSGLIGLLRHLHGQSYVLLAISRQENPPQTQKEISSNA